jgi:hypothetical protein
MNATKNKILRKDRFFAITFFDFFLMAKILSFDALDYPILKGFSQQKILNYDSVLKPLHKSQRLLAKSK